MRECGVYPASSGYGENSDEILGSIKAAIFLG
jgi:hypothetical protein